MATLRKLGVGHFKKHSSSCFPRGCWWGPWGPLVCRRRHVWCGCYHRRNELSFLTKGQSRPASFRRYIDNPGSAREKTIKRNGGQRIRKVQRVTCGILSSHVTRSSCSLSLVPLGSVLAPRAMRKACGAPLIILLLRRRAPHRLGCSRAALRQHRKNATTSLARSCCCRSSATGSRRRAPRRTCNGAPALAAPRAQYATRAAPGGCPLPRVPFLEPQRGSLM